MCKKVILILCLASYAGSFLTAQGNAKSNTNNPCDAALADAQFGLGNGDTKSAASNPSPTASPWR